MLLQNLPWASYQQWGKLELMYKDLIMQHGRENTHDPWGWEDLALKAGFITEYMTLNSNKVRIPSSMILMMIFTPWIPLERREKKCVCAHEYVCVHLSWIKAHRRQLFLFLQETVTLANPFQESATGKCFTSPLPSGPGVLCYSKPISLSTPQLVSTTGCFNDLKNRRDIEYILNNNKKYVYSITYAMRRTKRAFLSPWLQLYSQRMQLENFHAK